MKKILITGVAGFIGSNLADYLLKEGIYEVIGIDSLLAGKLEQVPLGTIFYEMDIRSPKIASLFEGVDTVFHLAAKNCLSDCQKDPVETADINITGTVQVFEAARQQGVRKVVYAESSVFYEGSCLFPTPETEMKPESFYAASKVSSHYFAECYKKYSDLKFTALRYFNVYGPRQDYRRTIPPVMSAFIIDLLKGKAPVIYGSGEKRRDFIYVDDVNRFHLQTIHDQNTDGKVFNLGSGINYSIKEIFTKISTLLQSSIQPIYQSDLSGEALTTLACIKEAQKVGWSPKITLDEGLKQSIQFIRENAL
jgi:UDP-glucose 4-epimerase